MSASHTTMVEITTKDGRRFAHRPDGVPGDPRHPVDTRLLEAKFRDCVSFAAQSIDARAVERAIDMVWNLDALSDVTEIVRILTKAP